MLGMRGVVQAIEHPVRTNQIPRQIPEVNWFLTPPVRYARSRGRPPPNVSLHATTDPPTVFLAVVLSCSVMVGGLLPFAAVFIELFFIMKSIWLDQYYYMYGFLTVVFVILIITCVEITIVIIYFTLCSEVCPKKGDWGVREGARKGAKKA